MRRGFGWTALALALACQGCADESATLDHEATLLATAAGREVVLERLDREPYAAILEVIRERAARPYETPDPVVWDHSVIGHNNEMAQANAVLAWLFDDVAAAARAKEVLLAMPDDFETNLTWDVNIRMPHVLIPYCITYDILAARGDLSPAEAKLARDRVTTVTSKFFAKYLDDGGLR